MMAPDRWSGWRRWWLDGLAVALAVVTCGAVLAWIDKRDTEVVAVAVAGLVIFICGHLAGWKPLMLAATIPILGVVAADVILSTEQTWSRSLVIGCLWFATIEASSEAIDWRALRRSAPSPAPPQVLDRLIDVLIVVGASAGLVIAAVAATLVAPQRTAVALTLGAGLLAIAVVAAGRAVAADRSVSGSADQPPA